MSISLPNSMAWGPQLAPGGHHIEGPQGIPLYVEAHGSPAAPTKIMLVHGGLQCSLSYRRQIAPLTERDCYIILFDLPWHGLSGPGMEQPAPRPTAEILGQSVAAVRAHFGLQEEPLTLLGWSYGGIVLRSYLLQMRPSNIAGLVFVAALLDFESFMPIALRESPQIVEVFQRLATPSAPMVERLVGLQMFVDSLWHHPPTSEDYYQVLGFNFRAFAAAERVMDTLIYGTEAPGDIQQALRQVGCPLLFVQGQRDALISPLVTRQFASALPPEQVEVVELPECGHSPFLERAADFNAVLLDFLEGPVRQFASRGARLPT
jgi:non-heme chloroperoxidase